MMAIADHHKLFGNDSEEQPFIDQALRLLSAAGSVYGRNIPEEWRNYLSIFAPPQPPPGSYPQGAK